MNRNFVTLQGFFPIKMERAEKIKADTSPLELYKMCINIPYCEGFTKNGPDVFKYEKIQIHQFVNDSDWSTVLPLNLAVLTFKRKPG